MQDIHTLTPQNGDDRIREAGLYTCKRKIRQEGTDVYFIKWAKQGFSFQNVEKAPVGSYPWGGDTGARAQAKLVFLPERGFFLRMSRRAPKAGEGESALIWTVNFFPAEGYEYFCFSMSPQGELRWDIGPRGTGRYGCGRAPEPEYSPRLENGLWRADLTVPLELIGAACRRKDFERGSILEGNFYSWEGERAGCWNRVTAPRPDIHCPQDFGQLIIA